MANALPASMKFVALSAPGGPENLALAEGPLPESAPGHVIVKVAYAGVNGPDIMQRKGLYPLCRAQRQGDALRRAHRPACLCAGLEGGDRPDARDA